MNEERRNNPSDNGRRIKDERRNQTMESHDPERRIGNERRAMDDRRNSSQP